MVFKNSVKHQAGCISARSRCRSTGGEGEIRAFLDLASTDLVLTGTKRADLTPTELGCCAHLSGHRGPYSRRANETSSCEFACAIMG
jgi:hypothetical protein